MKQIILASNSPRRKELLYKIVKEYMVDVSKLEEITTKNKPEEIVMELAQRKATDISKNYKEAVIIGADTMVAIGEDILGKPNDEEDCHRMLSLISGTNHQVYTGVSIVIKDNENKTETITTFVEKSEVYVDKLSEKEIKNYIDSGEPFDKAGGYGIQGLFGIHVSRIEGDYNTIVGFPVSRIYKELKKLKVL